MIEIKEIRLRDELMLNKLHEHFLDLVDEIEATKDCSEDEAITLMVRFYYLKVAFNGIEKRLIPRISAAYAAHQKRIRKNVSDPKLLKKVAKAIVAYKDDELEKEAVETLSILTSFKKQTEELKQARQDILGGKKEAE